MALEPGMTCDGFGWLPGGGARFAVTASILTSGDSTYRPRFLSSRERPDQLVPPVRVAAAASAGTEEPPSGPELSSETEYEPHTHAVNGVL